MSRTLKGMIFFGLMLAATALTVGPAEAGVQTSASGFQPATSTDAPFISRDFAFSGGMLYNNAPSTGTSHSVTASQGLVMGNNSTQYTFYGNGNGKTVTCTVYATDILTGSVTPVPGSKTATGIYSFGVTLNLIGIFSGPYFVNTKCDIPSATSTGAFSVFWGVQ
jgi:hypothetical protein